MPLYEYKCHRCGKTFEVIQKFSDEPLKAHAECGGEVERLLSAPSFQFKGTGWYVTDYGHHGSSPAHDGRNGNSDSDTKKETKSEPKPVSKPAAASTSPTKP